MRSQLFASVGVALCLASASCSDKPGSAGVGGQQLLEGDASAALCQWLRRQGQVREDGSTQLILMGDLTADDAEFGEEPGIDLSGTCAIPEDAEVKNDLYLAMKARVDGRKRAMTLFFPFDAENPAELDWKSYPLRRKVLDVRDLQVRDVGDGVEITWVVTGEVEHRDRSRSPVNATISIRALLGDRSQTTLTATGQGAEYFNLDQ
jgi:hypothetical protein